jgi:hypothetical protein
MAELTPKKSVSIAVIIPFSLHVRKCREPSGPLIYVNEEIRLTQLLSSMPLMRFQTTDYRHVRVSSATSIAG